MHTRHFSYFSIVLFLALMISISGLAQTIKQDTALLQMVDIDTLGDMLPVHEVNAQDSMVTRYFFSTAFEDERGEYIGRFGKRPISLDTIPYFSDTIIARRLAKIEGGIPLPYNRTVRAFIDYYTIRNRGYARMIKSREPHYFKIFETALARHGMPDELKYLAIVESGLNPRAISPAGAAGLWQFMPATGRIFGLQVYDFHDDRMEVYSSTNAACLYLKDLYGQFHDWPLALAAYNCGPGNVRKAIRRSGYQKDFWSVYDHLPRETRSYVPQFIALAYAMEYSTDHSIEASPLVLPLLVDTVYFSQFVRLKDLGRQLGLCGNEMDLLNPELRYGFVPAYADSYPVRVPSALVSKLYDNWQAILDSASVQGPTMKDLNRLGQRAREYYSSEQKLYYVVKKGQVLGIIASSLGVSVHELAKWNNLRGNIIHPGQRLTYFRNSNEVASPGPVAVQGSQPDKTPPSAKATVKPPDNKVYTVKPGDTLWNISRKFDGISIDQLRKLNNLDGNNIKPGMKLKVG